MGSIANGKPIDPSTQKTTPAYPLALEGLNALVEYKSNDSGLSNSIVSKVSLSAGAHFCYITQHEPVPEATWSTVQTSRNSHIDLHSGLLYTNHSCSPSLEFHVMEPDANGDYPRELPHALRDSRQPVAKPGKFGIAGEVRVAGDRDLKVGDDLTFFYPSTEWHSAKPFSCLCGSLEGKCIGTVQGADALASNVRGQHFLNAHVRMLAAEM